MGGADLGALGMHGPQSEPIDCGGVEFRAVLQNGGDNSDLGVGRLLEVVAIPQPGALVVAAVDAAGQPRGSVIDGLNSLIPCLEDRWAFMCEVVGRDGSESPIVWVRGAQPSDVESVVFRADARIGSGAVSLLDAEPFGYRVEVALEDGAVELVLGDEVVPLRALLRVGMRFVADVGSGGAVAVRRSIS